MRNLQEENAILYLSKVLRHFIRCPLSRKNLGRIFKGTYHQEIFQIHIIGDINVKLNFYIVASKYAIDDFIIDIAKNKATEPYPTIAFPICSFIKGKR